MAKEAPSSHKVRLTPLVTDPVFQCLRIDIIYIVDFEQVNASWVQGHVKGFRVF